jgi:hypothetical protein
MRIVLVLSLVVAVPASAQPVMPPDSCAVTITRAPDDVRATIEAALATEHCTVPLEVRVVPSEGSLYLLARDFAGRVRERVVPDARAVAVLVASWAADNGLAPPRAPVPSVTDPSSMIDAPPDPRHPDDERRVEVAVGLPLGVRVTADIFAHGRWTFGAALAATDRPLEHAEFMYNNTLASTRDVSVIDARVLGYVARTFGDGLWTIRTAIGVGVVSSTVIDDTQAMSSQATPSHDAISRILPMGEAVVLIGRDFGNVWGVDIGVTTSVYGQRIHIPYPPPFPDITVDHNVEVELAVGLRHRL